MKINLKDYRQYILGIADANCVTEDVARDMFVANLEKGAPLPGQDWYAGAEDAPYSNLNLIWAAMSVDEKNAACLAYVRDCINDR